MFRKGDYIVVLIDDIDKDFSINYIFKQRRDYLNLSVEKSIKNVADGWRSIKFEYSSSWRYADEEEIEEYERIQKPFDTSTMNRFILPDNWHIVVTEENAEDVLKWRFESSYSYKDKADYSDNLVGIAKEDNCYHKGHNPKTEIIGDTYDFGIEITYQQFKKYVLNQSPVKHKYLTELLEKLKVK